MLGERSGLQILPPPPSIYQDPAALHNLSPRTPVPTHAFQNPDLKNEGFRSRYCRSRILWHALADHPLLAQQQMRPGKMILQFKRHLRQWKRTWSRARAWAIEWKGCTMEP